MLYFIFKYSNSFWIILHLIIIILLFPALYSFDIYIRIISPVFRFSDFGGKSHDREGGQVSFCLTEYFLSDKNTTCSVRLNREST